MEQIKIQTIQYSGQQDLRKLLASENEKGNKTEEIVKEIVTQVRKYGDERVLFYVKAFDKYECTAAELKVTEEEFREAKLKISEEFSDAIKVAKDNIEKFHKAQQLPDIEIETMPGVVCRQKSVPIEKIGIYIPGGTAPLFSTILMLAIPAKIAGCKEITLCTPSNCKGEIAPEILYCAEVCGVKNIYKVGGAAAIAAMAYGTESISKVEKIFGPGNSYVTAAKQLVSTDYCAIDIPAGPSEVMILADESANGKFVCADFISQLEHGKESQAIIATTSPQLAEEVKREFEKEIETSQRKEFILASLKRSAIIIAQTRKELVEIANRYASEHLIINTSDYEEIADQITNAGSIFLGEYTPESAGDYASGTNHTLPTGGWAASYSGVNLSSFIKRITLQSITKEGLKRLAPTISLMAEREGLYGHKRAVEVREISIDEEKR